jgi:hypothetical protein
LYTVDTDEQSAEQVCALPAEALAAFAEARALLEVSPWSGLPIIDSKPDGPLRVLLFGNSGMITYLIVDRERRVALLEVLWAD